MKFFVGTYKNKMDAKGRISLPAPFRDIVTEGSGTAFYIFPSPNSNTLEAGGSDLMQYIASSIEEQAPMFSQEEDALSYIMASARLVQCDSTGRFVMPAEFIEFASLGDSVSFVGKARRFQIQNSQYNEVNAPTLRDSFSKSELTIKKPSGV